MKAKGYQKEAIERTTRFFDKVQEDELFSAFAFLEESSGGVRPSYTLPPWEEALAKSAPFVCLHAPTGSGKTTIAAGIIGEAANHALFGRAANMALIFAPTASIVSQTIRSYRDSTSLSARLLREQVGSFRVLTVEEALRLRPSDLQDTFILIVATYAAFRRKDKQSLSVYRNNGQLMECFRDISDEERTAVSANGGFSLANLISLQRPIIVADESHHSATELSHETIEGLCPRAVVETSATPRPDSNVVYRVDPLDVQRENMISLPVNVFQCKGWRDAIVAGKRRLERIEAAARKLGHTNTKRMLIAAERANFKESALAEGYVSVFDAIEELQQQGVAREEIAVVTGALNELDGVLLSQNTKIRYIITVKAAAEGWDSPEAYVLVALGVSSSGTVAEQMLGRVIRREGGIRHADDELNESYVFCGTPSFYKTVSAVRQGLEQNGYRSDQVVTEGATSPSPVSAKGQLQEKFSGLCMPSFEVLEDENSWEKIEDTGRLIELACGEGYSLDTSPLDKTVSREKENEAFVVDFDSQGALKIESTDSDDDLQRSVARHGDRQKIIDLLALRIRVTHVSHQDIQKIVQGTIRETYKSWSVADLWSHLDSIKDQISNKVVLRSEHLAKRGLAVVAGGKVRIGWENLSEQIEHSAFDATGIDTTNHVYGKTVALMNGLEIDLAERLAMTGLPWMRNPELCSDAFALPGISGMHYPDFLVFGKDGVVFVLETKGDHLLGSQDTKNKVFLGEVLTNVSGGRCQYYLVSRDGEGADETALDDVQSILADRKPEEKAELEVIS